MPLYSVWNPATSSLSASARSNGARLQLAVAVMKKTKNATNVNGSWNTYQFQNPPACCRPNAVRLSVPLTHTGTTTHSARGHLVAHHLRRLAQPAEQRPLARRGVPGQEHAEHLAGEHRQHEERGRRPGPGRPARGRTAGPGTRRRRRRTPGTGRAGTGSLSARVRGDVLLGDELDAVGERLEQAERPDAGRAEPVLDPGGHLPLGPDGEERGAADEPEERGRPRPRRRRRGSTGAAGTDDQNSGTAGPRRRKDASTAARDGGYSTERPTRTSEPPYRNASSKRR